METGRSLTEVVLSILRLLQLSRQSLKALVTGLKEADAFHVRHAVPFVVVYLVRQVDLVREES